MLKNNKWSILLYFIFCDVFYVKSSGQTCIEIYINIRTLLVFKIFPKKFFSKNSILHLQQSVIDIFCLFSLLKSLIYIKMSTEVDILKIYV